MKPNSTKRQQELKFAETAVHVFSDAMDDERLDPARWRNIPREGYASILAGAAIDVAVCIIKGLCDLEHISEPAFYIMVGSLRNRVDIAAAASIAEERR